MREKYYSLTEKVRLISQANMTNVFGGPLGYTWTLSQCLINHTCNTYTNVSVLQMDSVLLKDVKANAHEMCATKGGTVTNICVDP